MEKSVYQKSSLLTFLTDTWFPNRALNAAYISICARWIRKTDLQSLCSAVKLFWAINFPKVAFKGCATLLKFDCQTNEISCTCVYNNRLCPIVYATANRKCLVKKINISSGGYANSSGRYTTSSGRYTNSSERNSICPNDMLIHSDDLMYSPTGQTPIKAHFGSFWIKRFIQHCFTFILWNILRQQNIIKWAERLQRPWSINGSKIF